MVVTPCNAASANTLTTEQLNQVSRTTDAARWRRDRWDRRNNIGYE